MKKAQSFGLFGWLKRSNQLPEEVTFQVEMNCSHNLLYRVIGFDFYEPVDFLTFSGHSLLSSPKIGSHFD